MIRPGWEAAYQAVVRGRVTIVIGESDVGKTSLVTELANHLTGQVRRVAVVDADLGQSEIGPPMTIGLGRVRCRLARLGDAELVAMHFVGSTSPARELDQTVLGTKRMVDRARDGRFERILIDTSGLVNGRLGHALKRAKIDAVRPDVLIALQREAECEDLLRRYDGGARAVMRLPAVDFGRRRPTVRSRHRQLAFERYFASARSVRLELARVVLRPPGPPSPVRDLAQSLDIGEEFRGILVGLGTRSGETLGLGIVTHLDRAAQTLVVDTPVPRRRIAVVAIGRERLHDAVQIWKDGTSQRLVPASG